MPISAVVKAMVILQLPSGFPGAVRGVIGESGPKLVGASVQYEKGWEVAPHATHRLSANRSLDHG